MASLTVVIPGHPDNDNQRRKWHWSERSGRDTDWKAAARSVASNALPAGAPWDFVDIEVVFVKPTRAARDPDNVVGAAKPLIDGLVLAGLLPDDSDRHVRKVCGSTLYEKGVREVRVTVTQVGD
jgi:hypothetical protein